jgi:hypothetical protein
MLEFEPFRAGAARPSVWRVVSGLLPASRLPRRMIRLFAVAAIASFACSFTAQKPAEQPQSPPASAAPAQAPASIGTVTRINCYDEGRRGRYDRDCYQEPESEPEYQDNPEKSKKTAFRDGIRLLLVTLVMAALVGALIYFIRLPAPKVDEWCIPPEKKAQLAADIAAAFTLARSEATAAGITKALPLLRIAETGVTGAVNKLKVCDPPKK